MRVYYPGALAVPLVLTAIAVAAFVAPQWRVWSYWPVTLIATGIEEIYLWAKREA